MDPLHIFPSAFYYVLFFFEIDGDIYSDDTTIPEEVDLAMSLISLAHQFGVERLKDKITYLLIHSIVIEVLLLTKKRCAIKNKISFDNVLAVLTCAALYNCRQLYAYQNIISI